jgi:hypothetical protein
MDRDPLVRFLLFGILAALVALVVKLGESGGGVPLVGGGSVARFALDATHAGSPVMFRLNTQTGQTWKLELRGGNDTWKPIREPDDDAAPPGALATPRVPPPPVRPPVAPARTEAPAAAAPAPVPGREGPEWDVEALARALENTELNLDLRTWSAGRLALLDEPRSTDALLAAQADDEPKIVAAALEALKGRNDPRIPAAVERGRAHPNPFVQAAAAAHARPKVQGP